MKNILIHGLGQNNRDWDTIKTVLEARGISSIAPDLFDLARGRKLDYPTVYQAFSELCESYKDKLNLCGLSLGGLLALNYAIQYPKKINSLVYQKQGVGSKLLQLAKDNTPTMLYFGAQPGIEKFYEKNGCKRSLQSYAIEKERS